MVRSQAESALTIAGLAREGGVGVETVRYYQRRGLLPTPKRSGSDIRRYEQGHVRRLKFIRSAQAAGFALEQIAELIGLDATDDRPRARKLARDRVAALDLKIAELAAARDALARLAKACGSDSKGRCPILVAFER